VDLQAFVNHPLARRDFLIGVTGLAAVAASRWPAAASAAMWMHVGSFAGEGRGHGEGLSVFHRAGESDRWHRGATADGCRGPVVGDRRSTETLRVLRARRRHAGDGLQQNNQDVKHLTGLTRRP